MELKQSNMMIIFIGHRGNGYEIDYTLEETNEAIISSSNNSKISGIELDIRLMPSIDKTRGVTLIVHHDKKVNLAYPTGDIIRTKINNMGNYDLKDCMLEPSKLRNVLMSADVAFKGKCMRDAITGRFSSKVAITTLENILDQLAQKEYKGEILLHLKDYSDACLQALISIIRQYHNILNIKVQCDYEGLLTDSHKQMNVPCGLLANFNQINALGSKKIITASEIDFYSINWSPLPYYNRLQNFKNDYVQTICESQKQVYFWTIDSLTNMYRLLKFLYDIKKNTGIVPPKIAIISNFPTLLYGYLNVRPEDAHGLLWEQAISLFNELNGQLVRCPENEPKILLPKQPN